MARRALRKIDSSIDLTGRLKTFEQLPNPWDAAALFGRTAPLEIEVGSGKGLFLRNAAADRPATNFLGIEVVRGASGQARAVVDAWLAGSVTDSGVGCSAHEGHDCSH